MGRPKGQLRSATALTGGRLLNGVTLRAAESYPFGNGFHRLLTAKGSYA